MANEEQLELLKAGVEDWNKWREKRPSEKIDLSDAFLMETLLVRANLSRANLRRANISNSDLQKANLIGADLTDADLHKANLHEADLEHAYLIGADLSNAILTSANLVEASLNRANLYGADLQRSNLVKAELTSADLSYVRLRWANLRNANLTLATLLKADLRGADLRNCLLTGASLIETRIEGARISGSSVYAVNIWEPWGEFEEQTDLSIASWHEPTQVTVDNIEMAQFIYLLLKNEKLKSVINTLTSKSVLILGRFAIPERKAILDALRNKLREYDLLPIVFDFDRPTDKDFTETIKTLAGISYFVIADITNPKSSPLELQATVPDYQIPFVPIIQEGESPFAMMVDLQKKYPWVLPTRSYDSIETLMSALKPGIIDPAVEMRNKLRLVKAQEQVTESLRDYVDKTL